MQGKKNLAAGFLFLAGFMVYGFVLIYLRDFGPDKEAWIAGYSVGKHFESRLAHVHGNLFALLNVLIGYLILKLPISAGSAKWLIPYSAISISRTYSQSRPSCGETSK